jgi:hypothetical protein
MKNLLITILYFLCPLVYCQSERLSEHKISFNVNEKQKEIKNTEIFIMFENDTINGKVIEDKYYFPYIEKEFSIIIKINKTEFEAGPFQPTVLNSDCDIDLGIINNLKKMTSVAEYNGLIKSDEGWEWYSKKYFIVNNVHTIDIENPKKVKELLYVVLNGIAKSSEIRLETNIVVQKITKIKNAS